MKTSIEINNINFTINLSKPIDISIPLTNKSNNLIAWHQKKPIIEPVKTDNWIGSVALGGSINFNNIYFNPHAHGTHTECLGHITQDFYSIHECLKQFFFVAQLISVVPIHQNNDLVITKEQLEPLLHDTASMNQKLTIDALIIRTLPNAESKINKNYSNTNPPYLTEEAAMFICESNINHLLIDLPSIDKEQDEGKLLAHKAFWNVKNISNLNYDAKKNNTITEMIYVPQQILDGYYFLNLQIASFENDASPSRPLLFEINEIL